MAAAVAGASAAAPATGPAANVTRYLLAKETELRFEVTEEGVDFGCVKLVSGNAEVFGVELAEGRTYQFPPGRKVAVFSWYGAELHLWGSVASGVYTASDAPNPLYANLHQRLEARREEARLLATHGPRVCVVGPTDSGKSSLCRLLCAYAARVGRAVTFVDTDVGQGELSLPGCVAAATIDRSSLSVEAEGFAAAAAPLVYAFGHATPTDAAELFRNSLSHLADTVNRRLSLDDTARVGGCVINTMGFIDGVGYELLLETIRLLQADVVVVLGHDRLFARLTEDLKALRFPVKPAPAATAVSAGAAGASAGGAAVVAFPDGSISVSDDAVKVVTVVKLPRSGGVVERSRTLRRDARRARIREYFYGPYRGSGLPPALSPASLVLGWDELVVVRVGGMTSDVGLLPIGKTTALDPLRTTVVPPAASLLTNHVLAVSFAASERQVPHVNVAGFVHVTSVDAEKRTVTLLSPSGGPLPSPFLLLTSITWTEG